MKKRTFIILFLGIALVLLVGFIFFSKDNQSEKVEDNHDNTDVPSGISQEFKESWFGDEIEK